MHHIEEKVEFWNYNSPRPIKTKLQIHDQFVLNTNIYRDQNVFVTLNDVTINS